MGYTGTTNYGFQKPAKENAFTVDDLNNALDKIDETIKDESIVDANVDLDEESMEFKIELTKGSGTKTTATLMFPEGQIEFVTQLPNSPEVGKVYGIVPEYGVGYITLRNLQYYMDNSIPDDTIYSIIYDKSKASDSSGCLEYADFCEGFEPMLGGNGNADEGDWKEGNTTIFDKIEVGYYDLPSGMGSNWLRDYTIWKKVNKKNISFDKLYNFTKIPKIYQKIESLDSNRTKLSISLAPFTGATLHPSFIVDGVEKPYVHIGRTLGYLSGFQQATGKYNWLYSQAGYNPTASQKRATFRETAQNNDNCNITSYYDRDLINKLYLFAFKDFNSQKALGVGYTGGSSAKPTGGTAGKSWMYGTTDDSEQMSFLGLEDWWGNLHQWIDDYVLYNGTIYVGTNSNPTDDTSGKTAIGQFAGSSGAYPLKAKFGLNDTFISEASGGSATTGMCDYQYWNNSGTYIASAGYWNFGSDAGAFYLRSNTSVSTSTSSLGARLTYKP